MERCLKCIPKNNSITDMLERIIYSAIQSNDEDTYLSEFVYYLKRLGAFSSEEIIEFVIPPDAPEKLSPFK